MINPKVAIVVCAFPPQGGGMGGNAFYQAKKLGEDGYAVSIFTLENLSGKIEAENFSLEYLPARFRFGHAGFMKGLWKSLKSFDIIHLYYPFFGTDLIVALFKLFHPKKKLVIHYQMDAIGFGYQKYFFKIYLGLFLNLILSLTDKIFVLSLDHSENSYLKNYLRLHKDKFEVVPNAIDEKIFYPREKNLALAEKLEIKSNEKTIIFVGGLDQQHFFKGVEVLLPACQKISESVDLKLIVVGDGDLKKYYQQMTEDLGLKEKVIFVGWIDSKDLPNYYSLADVFVLPSTVGTESFGIVIAEAQACGVPAVVSNWPGSRKTIVAGETGLIVEPQNIDDLAEKLKTILTDDNARKSMSKKASQNSLEKYSWGQVVKKIENIYKDLN